MSEATERLLVRIDATTEQLRRELKKADDAVKGTQTVIERSLSKIDKSFDSLKKQFTGLGAAISGIGIGLAVREIMQASDKMASLRGQLGLVTSSQEELNATYARALKLANETGQSTESTVNLYARLARSTEELGLSQGQLFDITKAINQSFVVSGASAQEAGSAIIQLSQGLAAGALRGEELNSVMENSPRLARALADGLGVTIGQLREMGKEGELTAEAVTSALLKTADSINGEFQQMPMTISRVWQTMSNDIDDALGSVDASPLISSIEELRSVISDPNFKAAIVELSDALLRVVASSASALAGLVDLTKWVGEEMAAAVGGIAGDDIPRLEEKLAKLRKELEFYSQPGHGTQSTIAELTSQIAKLEAQLDTARSFQEGMAVATEKTTVAVKSNAKAVDLSVVSTSKSSKATKEYEKAVNDLAKSMDKLESRHLKANEQITDGIRELDELVESADRYIDDLEFEVSLLDKSAREQAILTAEREHGARATAEQRDRIAELTGTLYDSQAATAAAAEAQKPLQDALGETISRIDTAFASAWKGAFDSFDDFADGLKSAFRELIGELLHIAITKPIILSLGASFGLGGSPVASAAGGLGGGGLGGLGSLASSAYGAFSQGSSLFTNQGLQFAVPGDGGAALGASFNWANAGLGLAGGLAGGFAANQVFGRTSGIGSTLGGLAGTLIPGVGPLLGAGIGSFLGGGLESILGGKNNGDNKGRASLDFSTGQYDVYGVGKSFNQANVDALSEISSILVDFASMIGGTGANLDLSAGNNSGLKLNGQKYSTPDELVADALDEMVAAADALPPYLKKVIAGFDGTAEETVAFAAGLLDLNAAIYDSLAVIDAQMKLDPIGQAAIDFEASQQTLSETYYKQIGLVNDLATSFDGSLLSLQNLNSAFAMSQQLAYEMAKSIEQIGLSSKQSVNAAVEYFEAQVRTSDEQIAYWQKQVEFAFAILPNLTDPGQIQDWSNFLIEASKKIFDAGPDDLKQENVQTYVDFVREVGRITEEALNAAKDGLIDSQGDMNTQVQNMLSQSAARFQDSADTMFNAAKLMYSAVQQLFRDGYFVGSTSSEVV